MRYAQQAGALAVLLIDSTECLHSSEACEDAALAARLTQAREIQVTATATTLDLRDPTSSHIRIPCVMISAIDSNRLLHSMDLRPFEMDGELEYA